MRLVVGVKSSTKFTESNLYSLIFKQKKLMFKDRTVIDDKHL